MSTCLAAARAARLALDSTNVMPPQGADLVAPGIRRSAAIALSQYGRMHQRAFDGGASGRFLIGQVAHAARLSSDTDSIDSSCVTDSGTEETRPSFICCSRCSGAWCRDCERLRCAVCSNRTLLFDHTPNHITQVQWQPVYRLLDPLLSNASDSLIAQRAIRELLLCTPSVDQLMSSAANSVYLYPSEPDSTLGFYPVHANSRFAEVVTRNFGQFWYYFGAQYLFQLRPPQLNTALAAWRQIKHNALAVVGLHLRWGRGAVPADKYFTSWAQLRSLCVCALHAARVLIQERQLTLRQVVVLVASDSNAALAEARAVLGSSVRVESVGGFTRGFDIGFEVSAIEMQLLGWCDSLVATRSSSFSFAAHAGSLIVPWMMLEGKCQRAKNSQINMRLDVGAEHPWSKERFERASCTDNATMAAVIDMYEDQSPSD